MSNKKRPVNIDKKRAVAAVALVAVGILLGILLFRQWASTRWSPEEMAVREKSFGALQEDYLELQEKNRSLNDGNKVLKSRLEAIEGVGSDHYSLARLLEEEVALLEGLSGLIEVSGQGVVITVTPNDSTPISANMLLQLANELRSADARAIAVNGQRLTALSEIRDTVDGFSVNRTTFLATEPIVITVVGDGANLLLALSMPGGILERWRERDIDVSTDIVENLIVAGIAQWQYDYMFDNSIVVDDDSEE